MDGTWGGMVRSPPSLHNGLTQIGQQVWGCVWEGEFCIPVGVGAVEVDLINGLTRVAMAQFWRAIGGQDEEWHMTFVGFDDGWVEVSACGAGSTNEGDGDAGTTGKAKGKKGGGALI
jgi:hypothetical protein